MATSRLGLLVGILVARLVAAEGVGRSRLADGDGFRMSRLEFADGRLTREADRGLVLADFEFRVVVTVFGNLGIRKGDVGRAVAGDLVRRVAGRADVLRPAVVLEREGCADPRLEPREGCADPRLEPREGCADPRLEPREGNLTVPRDDELREAELRELVLREAELRVEEERGDAAAELRDEPDLEDERLTVRVEPLERLEDRGEREALLDDRPELLRDEERPEVFWDFAIDGASSSARMKTKLTMPAIVMLRLG